MNMFGKGVGPHEIARSLQYFRDLGFDIDQFLDGLDVDEILRMPFSGTVDCLSPNEIASLVERDQLDSAKRLHVGGCADCRRLIGIYQRASQDDWAADDELHIVRSEQIWIPDGGDFYLIIANRGKRALLGSLDPDSVEVKGKISGRECSIQTLDPAPYDAHEAVRLLFNEYKVGLPRLHDTAVPCRLTIEGKSRRRLLKHQEVVYVRQTGPDEAGR
jgi:hypothetical protein